MAEPLFKSASRPCASNPGPSDPGAAAHRELSQALLLQTVTVLPLPAVALRVVNMSEDTADAAQLAGLVQKDAGLAAQIVKVANSALYARRNPVTSLQQAISWLGIGEVRKLAVSCAVRAQFAGKNTARALAPVWCESLATACFSQEIARLRRRAVEPAYLAGLLHRSGYAALLQLLARKESTVAVLAANTTLTALAAEFEAPLAHSLIKDWDLPDSIAVALRYWRAPQDTPALQLGKPLRLALLEVVLARALAAQLQNEAVLTENAAPPELIDASASLADELGIYQDDLQTLWGKRDLVIAAVASLQ